MIMDTLIRERNGIEEIWYSGEYLKNQIEAAFRAGIHKGIKVNFHAIVPMNGEAVNDLTDEFNKRIEEEYQTAFSNSEVYRISK